MILTTTNVSKKYSNKTIIKDINLQISKGDIIGLVGRNGAGKSTLLTILSQLPITYNGDVNYHKEFNRDSISSLIDTPDFFPYLSGFNNLLYFGKLKKLKNTESKCLELLNEVDLYHARNKKFGEYSLGMKQRLGIALALMNSPKFLILDEPFNGIDPEGIVELRNLLLRLNQAEGLTILISSHILSDLYKICNRFIFLNKQTIIADISKDELKNNINSSESIEDYYLSVIR
ncbi:TPA: ABC transporter ATP-binding protein [Streptococcus pyogenes]|uniref:ABC transporter ATP-binding protein n=1 Tax=Streptococcus pyogenes TaxID=1314 RepID=UPI000F6DCAF6|nr:ABC transporter ATP-binding protein [Streptococcus pyogenes]HER4598210.1 ABC transporter ATP-binding protein [Streptococcus pyogenes NGAS606]HER4727922.1 ABC transporter ATP-binding protein [Streptococcus pyogenes NGAS312]VED83506.1 multidrug ABC transporter ATPase [Streptococcus pyogenes]VGS64660.1 multidrug ABC transporter ATPase [Streptococcus pyogenes]HEP6034721.1 ABC transporter ATP-binding protein [Streptococcus pyogenes]